MGDLELIFEIAHRSQTAKNQVGLLLTCALHCQAVKTDDLHSLEVRSRSADLLKPLLQGEGWGFVWVLQHRHHHLTKKLATAFNQVEMAQGERVKAAGVKSAHRSFCTDRIL